MRKQIFNKTLDINFEVNNEKFNKLDVSIYFDNEKKYYFCQFTPQNIREEDGFICHVFSPCGISAIGFVLLHSGRNTAKTRVEALNIYNGYCDIYSQKVFLKYNICINYKEFQFEER